MRSIKALSRILVILATFAAVALLPPMQLSSSPEPSEVVDSDRLAQSAVGWRELCDSCGTQTSAGSQFGLRWNSESTWFFTDYSSSDAVVRLNDGPLVPGDIVMEYLVRTREPDKTAAYEVYGQATYCGFDSTGFLILESMLSIPSSSHFSPGSDELSNVQWTSWRSMLTTSPSARSVYCVFPADAESIAFGPTGRLGFRLAFTESPDEDDAVLANAKVLSISLKELDQQQVDDEEATDADDQSGSEPLTDLATPESTAAYFLDAVMVDRDPTKAKRAWSPRVPSSAIDAVIAHEIELFADRSSDVLRFVLDSLSYSSKQVSEHEVVVSIVDNGEEAVLGRLELYNGEWLFIALGYQLDQDLNVSPEWQRVIDSQ
ncbi:MAG: hypothetical protein WBK72_01375 [Bacillota bacterium]